MRILHLISTLTGGGAERQLSYLTAELQQRGHQTLVGYVNQGPAKWPNDTPVRQLKISRSSDPRLIWHVWRLVREFKPDVINTWILQMDVVGGMIASLTRTPWVLREPTAASFWKEGVKARLRDVVSLYAAKAVIANSQGGYAYWEELAPHLPRHLITNAVPVEAIEAVEPAATGGNPTAVYAGRLQRIKNVDLAITAIARVNERTPVDFVICGHGPEREALEKHAASLGIENRVRFVGQTDEVWSFIKAADFFLLLSDYEGTPNAALEGFAAGTPAILSDIPALHTLAPEDCAYFVKLHDADDTARAILHVLNNPAEAKERARCARRIVESRSISAATDAFENVYASIRKAETR